jgi:hypothetical protein
MGISKHVVSMLQVVAGRPVADNSSGKGDIRTERGGGRLYHCAM